MKVWLKQNARGAGLTTLALGISLGTFSAAYAFEGAPMFDEAVKSGALPPVDERLPSEPLTQDVTDAIGSYGGTLRRGFLGPSDHNNYTRVVYDALVRHAPDGGQVIPHIAKGWESNDDFSEWTVLLREGMKWSDGEPLTADDIMFWYNSILGNSELTPSTPLWMQNSDGSVAKVEKLSDTSVRWTFGQPNTAFLLALAGQDGADKSINNLVFAPAHYLKQFHPDFASENDLNAKVSDSGFDVWTQLFSVEALPHLSGNRPGTAAWVPLNGSTVADETFTIERNPYYFAVDSDGNQLPYIDSVTFKFFADKETLNLAAVGGQIDMQGRHLAMSNFPVLMENSDKGGYKVITYPTFGGSDAVLMFNQTYTNDEAIGEILREKDFRIALSHSIDRDAIKELAFLGIGEARQGVPAPFHPYYPGDEYAFKYTQLDTDIANGLLDGIGLSERDGDGFRLLPNGDRLDIEVGVVPAFASWADIGQLVVEDWAEVGVRAHIELRERTPHFAMRVSNDLQVEIWNEDTTGFPFSGQPKFDPRSNPSLTLAPLVPQWIKSNGAEGMAPPAELQRIMDIIDEGKLSGRDRQIELAQELFRIWADNVWEIGTVGLTPMVQGVVVVNSKLRNVAEVAGNDWPLRTPGNTRPEQFFFTD
jgi:peptide/nickel transport system substrate-binding protein|tara:strand:- start:7526 stop:9466 length:1941 start_codon:yes stop_codon:yes gene_type:complete